MAKRLNGSTQSKGKHNRKWGRNKEFCLKYEHEGRREKNKALKLQRHIKKFPEDKKAHITLKNL